MLVFSNRDVFVLGQATNEGIQADVVWLKQKDIAGTDQELWDTLAKTIEGRFTIPKDTGQVHTDILLPYVAVEDSVKR